MQLNTKKFISEKTKHIKRLVGDGIALCATSGGVDSMVCAFLGHKALGKNLIALFIDDGLMREGEPTMVARVLRKKGIQTIVVHAAHDFFKALRKKEDPEDMRKAFRHQFYRTLGTAVQKCRADFLIQGTIAADIKETKGRIKSQHNVLSQVGISPKKYGLSIIEPLVRLYKPDVRRVGKTLGLPRSVYTRMPFPGPGLATRVVGEVTPSRIRIVRTATTIVEQELKRYKSFQAFAVLLTDRATGIRKGRRQFGNIIVVRSVESDDALTARPTRVPFAVLEKIQRRIVREIPQVNRVLYDVTPKPPATIEYI